jgi:protein-tyrosine phosphatase
MMYKVLFVCLGNICRSPLAETLFLKQINELQLNEKFRVDSCGLNNYHTGELADRRTRQIARQFGIEMTHRSRQIKISDFELFDEMIVMDELVLDAVLGMKPKEFDANKIKLLRTFDPNGYAKEIPDPYYSSLDFFEEVHLMIERCTAAYLKTLLT